MPTEVYFRNLKADDHKTYYTWMRRTTLTYVLLILFGLGMAVLVSMKAGSVAEIDVGAIGMAAP